MICDLLGQGKLWIQGDECEREHFFKKKELLLVLEVLRQFDPDLPIQLACDASPYGLRVVISHIMLMGEKKPIPFALRTLSKAKSHYAKIEQKHYYYLQKVQVSSVLTWIKFHTPDRSSSSHIISWYDTWLLYFQLSIKCKVWFFCYLSITDIQHRNSVFHGYADGLSRLALSFKHQKAFYF